jgi:hypothetical protein
MNLFGLNIFYFISVYGYFLIIIVIFFFHLLDRPVLLEYIDDSLIQLKLKSLDRNILIHQLINIIQSFQQLHSN